MQERVEIEVEHVLPHRPAKIILQHFETGGDAPDFIIMQAELPAMDAEMEASVTPEGYEQMNLTAPQARELFSWLGVWLVKHGGG